jgi:hypothetical protein
MPNFRTLVLFCQGSSILEQSRLALLGKSNPKEKGLGKVTDFQGLLSCSMKNEFK